MTIPHNLRLFHAGWSLSSHFSRVVQDAMSDFADPIYLPGPRGRAHRRWRLIRDTVRGVGVWTQSVTGETAVTAVVMLTARGGVGAWRLIRDTVRGEGKPPHVVGETAVTVVLRPVRSGVWGGVGPRCVIRPPQRDRMAGLDTVVCCGSAERVPASACGLWAGTQGTCKLAQVAQSLKHQLPAPPASEPGFTLISCPTCAGPADAQQRTAAAHEPR